MTEVKAQTLEFLPTGETAVILSVGGEKGPLKRRLVDMGLTPGTKVTVRKVAPFGDPIEVRLRGYELSLRKEDAGQITVCPPEDAPKKAKRPENHGMIQRVPDEETLRRMAAAHKH
ncbi:MAG: FeoA family protein, partial [Oscillospiraceae bacterium]